VRSASRHDRGIALELLLLLLQRLLLVGQLALARHEFGLQRLLRGGLRRFLEQAGSVHENRSSSSAAPARAKPREQQAGNVFPRH
jgi:hypothetical protein